MCDRDVGGNARRGLLAARARGADRPPCNQRLRGGALFAKTSAGRDCASAPVVRGRVDGRNVAMAWGPLRMEGRGMGHSPTWRAVRTLGRREAKLRRPPFFRGLPVEGRRGSKPCGYQVHRSARPGCTRARAPWIARCAGGEPRKWRIAQGFGRRDGRSRRHLGPRGMSRRLVLEGDFRDRARKAVEVPHFHDSVGDGVHEVFHDDASFDFGAGVRPPTAACP